MTSLLLTAFPSARAVYRRTADADAALSTQLAASGQVHDALESAGYRATSGNSYEKDGQQIDLLVPATASRFGTEYLGERAFDAVPGLMLALASEPIVVRADIQLTTSEGVQVRAPLPSVESAIVLKAASYASRRAAKDLTDLHNLLLVVDERNAKDIGGWSLGEPAMNGAKRDAQAALHGLTRNFVRPGVTPGLDIRTELLVSLIRTHVAHPAR